MTTDKTIKSKYLPKQTNVTWVDLSGETPIEKHFINGRWIAVSGGGGAGSSNPTEADATKVWQVTPVQKGTKTEEFIIAPKQTLDIDIEDLNSCILQNINNLDKFVNGAKVIAVIDGIEYKGTINQYGGLLGVMLQEEPQIGIMKVPAELSPTGEEVLALQYQGEHEVSVNVVEETPIYDYNWAPGVKIPIPTAEDEGKILVVTKVEGDNTSIIVPEQEVPADDQTPLTDVDLTKFVAGNTVKVTITYGEEQGGEFNGSGTRGVKSANSQTFTATGVIVEQQSISCVIFEIQELDDEFEIAKIENSLMTNAFQLGLTNSTIKLEYIESNYEYQLQENSGGSSTSDVLWPAMYEYDDEETMATFVPENVEPNTWCMVCGNINGGSIDTCWPVLITSYGNYLICNKTNNSVGINVITVDGGSLLLL